MSESLKIRWITENELEWVNCEYAKIDFQPSKWATDKVAVAIVDNEKIGFGRLVLLEDGSCELGGFFVREDHRMKGIARQLVSYLLKNSPTMQKIYCLPFEKLKRFYASLGFQLINNEINHPQSILEKHLWCLEHYPDNVLLMLREESNFGDDCEIQHQNSPSN